MVRLRVATAALVAVWLLTGCDDDPEPKIEDPTPSVSPSPSESATATAFPTAAAISARETVDVWLRAWSAALVSGDATEVMSLSSDTCLSCQGIFDRLANIYDKGGSLQTAGWSASEVKKDPRSTAERQVFIMRITQARQILLGENGDVVDDTPETEVPMVMTLAMEQSRWVLAELEEIK